MTRRYDSSPANLRALRDRLTQAARREGVVFGRLQQHVAVLVVAQFMAALTGEDGEPLLLVKGGTSLELRRGIAGSRTSKDLDAVTRADMQVVHERLSDAGETGWEGFAATFTAPAPFEVPGQLVNPQRFTAKLSYRGKPFASVPIEVSAIEAGNAERYDNVASQALALVGLPTSDAVPCMTLPWQIAQKLHAVTEVPEDQRTNDRAHDLVDLQLLEALLADSDLSATRNAGVAVFETRAQQPWPPTVRAERHWAPIYGRSLEGLDHLGLASTVDAAVERVQAFVDRIDQINSKTNTRGNAT